MILCKWNHKGKVKNEKKYMLVVGSRFGSPTFISLSFLFSIGSLTPRDLWSYLYTNPQHCPLTWLETLLHTINFQNWIKWIQDTSSKLASESILLVASTEATLLLFGERSSTTASSLGASSIWIVDFWEQAAGTNICLVTVCNDSLAFLLNSCLLDIHGN